MKPFSHHTQKIAQKLNDSKIVWAIWLLLALMTTSTMTFMDIAIHAPAVPVQLRQGTQIAWQTWRPFATEQSQFEMAYSRDEQGDLRLSLLGNQAKGELGASVLMRVGVNGQFCDLKQNYVSGWNERVYRSLELVDSHCRLPEQSGVNHWVAEVGQVDSALQNEHTLLGMISPAGTLKNPASNRYGTMAEMLFWGKLIWLPFFIFMSLPLLFNGLVYVLERVEATALFQKWEKKLFRKK